MTRDATVMYNRHVAMAKTPNRHSGTAVRIKQLRLSTGLSQERFAPHVGITRRHLIRLENGEHRPQRQLAARIEAVVEELTGAPVREHILGDEDEDEDASTMALARELHAVVGRLVEARLAQREKARS